MCGIAGVLSGQSAPPPALDQLHDMAAMLGHRGPDGYGLYRDAHAGLAHTRLSLIDLAGGFQPIHNGDGTTWLCFNGEIFNYVELRRHLMELGHSFYTEGDSEVIVQCYERYGERCWEMLNGQFAFALWDSGKRRLWLVRDRLGILPLHYARVGDQVAFASEAKALFASGLVTPRFDPAGLAKVFTFWSATAPHTAFDSVRMVPPATALRFDADLSEREERYWQPDPHRLDLGMLDRDQAVSALEQRLSQSISLRLRADLPVGAYVSGGLDSAVIASMAKDQVGTVLETFGIGFDDPRFDETEDQNHVVDFLGTRHHGFRCGADSIRDALGDVTWHCEAPMLRTSPVPLYLLSRQVRQAGMRTVLTGEGADELLAGYTIFKEDQIRRFWARRPGSAMRPALLNRIHHYVGGDKGRSARVWQSFFGRDLAAVDHPFYSHLIRWHNTAWTLGLLAPEVRDAIQVEALMAEAERGYPQGWRDWDPLTRASWIEIHSFLSSWLLAHQGDRVAMAHGIEARYPFLDPDVVDFCLALPKRHKMIGLRDKVALRRLAAQRLPPAVSARRKQPFRAPIGQVLFGPEANGRFDHALSESALAELGVVDPAAVRHLLRKARHQGGLLSEREEMGLVGVLTLSLLGRHFGKDFYVHLRRGRQAHERQTCHVFVDRLADAAG